MKLKALLKGLSPIDVRGSREIEITGISSDSRTVAPGNLFLAKRGLAQDGSQFIAQAVATGAAAIMTDLYDPFLKAVQLITAQPDRFEAELAARYYQHPSKHLFVVGVTGTKGKTTTTYLIQHLLNGLGQKCGLIGTVETVIGDHRLASTLTTHDVIYNQKILNDMVVKGCKAVSFEVSSHGLDQGRVESIDFDVGLWTNLYPDHLDYHATMEQYAEAKKKLLTRSKKIIVNADSPWSSFFKINPQAFTFGINTAADVRASLIEEACNGMVFWVEYQGKKERFSTPLLGKFNVYNLLGAIALGLQLGESLETISANLSTFQCVPGRLQYVGEKKGTKVFIDHGHTEEALSCALETLRSLGKRKLFVVFGCGGNRDPRRRKGMARAAQKWADLTLLTNDNPRQEPPEEIIREILSGFQNLDSVKIELDRRLAIRQALALADDGDIVLVAGKGHEKVQIFAHQTLPFDDAAVVQEELFNKLG